MPVDRIACQRTGENPKATPPKEAHRSGLTHRHQKREKEDGARAQETSEFSRSLALLPVKGEESAKARGKTANWMTLNEARDSSRIRRASSTRRPRRSKRRFATRCIVGSPRPRAISPVSWASEIRSPVPGGVNKSALEN